MRKYNLKFLPQVKKFILLKNRINIARKSGYLKKKLISKKTFIFLLLITSLYVILQVYQIDFYSLLPHNSNDQYRSISGFDIYYLNDNPSNTSYKGMISLQPLSGTNNILVLVSVVNERSINDFPSYILINFPGDTTNHVRYKSIDELMSIDEPLENNFDDWYKAITADISNDIHVFPNYIFGTELICIDTHSIENFSGSIGFLWVDGIKKTTLYGNSIDLPFNAPEPEPEFIPDTIKGNLSQVNEYDLYLLLPENNHLDSSIPLSKKYNSIGLNEQYYFSFNLSDTDFKASYSHNNAKSYEDFLLLISSLFLGICISLILERKY